MATILDVAREAGVAPSTVSLVTNGRSRVSTDTRRRVQQAIRDLGYRPRRKRPRVRKASELNLAVVYCVSTMGHETKTVMTKANIQGVAQVLSEAGAGMHLIGIYGQLNEDPVLETSLRMSRLDGLVLIGMDPTDRRNARFIRQTGLPVVVVNRRPAHAEFSAVTADYYDGGRLATQHLIDHGHQRIAFIGLGRPHWPTRERYRGYRDVLHESGLKPSDSLVSREWISHRDEESVDRFCRRALADGATAFVLGDSHAVYAADTLSELGRHVPNDISLVGFDNLDVTLAGGVTLTSIDYDKRYLGELAGSTLIRMATSHGRISSMVHVIPTRLIRRESVAKVRK